MINFNVTNVQALEKLKKIFATICPSLALICLFVVFSAGSSKWIHPLTYMSAHTLLKLLNKLGKKGNMQGFVEHIIDFPQRL